jgi:hypothetical protein
MPRPLAPFATLCALAVACASPSPSSAPLQAAAPLDASKPAPAPPPPGATPSPLADAGGDARATAKRTGSFEDWIRARLPPGAKAAVVAKDGRPVVMHTVAAGDTALSIATAYLDLTDVYRAKDLATEIQKSRASLAPGATIEIPHLLAAPYKDPDEDRLGWPEDKALRGIFITGAWAGLYWPETIAKMAARGLNAIVLDAKDYDGPVNYPTKVQLAIDLGAAAHAPIPDFARAIRFAHARGIRIIARVPCFHDPWAAKRAPRLSLQGNWGGPFPMGWLDPANVEAEDYAIAIATEAIDAGADEIQLDYVRFPVSGKSLKAAIMPAPDGHRSQAIRKFVDRVHEVVHARGVPLSLDIFGVAATGEMDDIEALGQNIATIGGGAEALSPMIYPSHYSPGYRGWDTPGNHPEIIGIGTRAALEKLAAAKNKTTAIRPWLQAASYKSPAFGPKYIQDEIKSAEAAGSLGWLMWDPGNSYWAVWMGVPPLPSAHAEAGGSAPPRITMAKKE